MADNLMVGGGGIAGFVYIQIANIPVSEFLTPEFATRLIGGCIIAAVTTITGLLIKEVWVYVKRKFFKKEENI